jgi:hypothetical protein
LNWLYQLPEYRISGEAKSILDSGCIYQCGRDKNFQPLVIIVINRIEDLKANREFLVEALQHMLVMVREKMLLPYHVERWNLMIDTDDAGVIKNLKEFMEQIYSMVRDHFPMTLNKIYLMNVNMMMDIKEQWNRKYKSN